MGVRDALLALVDRLRPGRRAAHARHPSLPPSSPAGPAASAPPGRHLAGKMRRGYADKMLRPGHDYRDKAPEVRLMCCILGCTKPAVYEIWDEGSEVHVCHPHRNELAGERFRLPRQSYDKGAA